MVLLFTIRVNMDTSIAVYEIILTMIAKMMPVTVAHKANIAQWSMEQLPYSISDGKRKNPCSLCEEGRLMQDVARIKTIEINSL
jgi:hypothetical protein